MHKIIVFLPTFLLICGTWGHLLGGDHLNTLNFIGRTMADGVTTLRAAYGGILGYEMVVDRVGEQGLFLREVTDGKHLVKMVYSDKDTLLTCDLLKDDPQEMLQFLKHFLSRQTIYQSDLKQGTLVHHLAKQGNFSWSKLDGDYIRQDPVVSRLVDIKGLTSECREFYRAEKHKAKVQAVRSRSDEADGNDGKHRQKRDGELIYPGTKWCGKGSVGQDYEDLGDRRETDKCCRTHDQCPYYIEGFTRKFGYYNYRMTTVSHCDCDERFRTCLKYRNNPVADNLGEIFFNRLATKCFTFTPQRVCAKRSFWGRCTEYKHEYQAVIQDPLEY